MDREAMIAALIFGGSGSGGSGLPDVTISDNGKSLKVVSGAWAAEDDEFVVTFTKNGSVWSADKGEDEIKAAITAKKRVFGKVNGASITEDNNIKMYTVIVPLEGTSASHGTVFGGALQSATNTVFCTFIVYGFVVTAYTKTVAIPDSIVPFIVNFTITGLPTGTSYPVTVDVLLNDIYAAVQSGQRVIGSVALSAVNVALADLSGITWNANRDGYVAVDFNIIGLNGGVVTLGHANISDDGISETASLDIIPLSTAQMSYDSGTGTLAITE